MSEVINNLLVELSLDSKDFESGMKDVNRATKQMETAFNAIKKALALSEKGIEDYTKAVNAGENVLKQYENKLDALNKAYVEQQDKLKSYKKEFDELPSKIADAEKKLQDLAQTVGTGSKEYKDAEKELQKYQQKLDGMDRTLSSAVAGLRSFENQIAQTENKMTSASKEVGQLKDELAGLDEVNTSNLSSMFDDLDIGDFTGEIEGLDSGLDLLSLGAKGAGLALAGMFTASIIDGAKSFDKAITDLEINLGVTEKQAESLHKKIKDFSDGGYNIENVADAVTMLSQTMSLSDQETEKLSQTMDILNGKGFEINDMVRLVQSGYQNWGTTGEETLGILIRGMQNGMDISGDLLDTFLEYAPIFAQNKVAGEEMLSLIEGGMKSTGMTADNTADVIKEFFLKFSEGGDAVEGTFDELGLDLGTLQSQVDSGKITMSDAFKTVAGAITDVEDSTDQARIMAELFGGTTEWTNAQAFESWANLETKTYDVATAVDEVTTAYENSYQASQQDFSNSWNELKETIGSGVLPILTTVMDTFNLLFSSVGLGVSNVVLNVQTMANQIKAFFQEIQISILETFVNNPIAEKLFPGMEERLATAKQQHEETINYIQENERKLAENAKASDELYKGSKKQTFDEIKTTADQKTKETSDVIDKNTKDGANKAKANLDTMKTDVENSLSGLGNIALTSTGEIPKATKQNLDESARVIKQFGTDAYLGVKTSFSKLEESAKQSMTNLYKGVSTSMSKTKTNVMQDATGMYNQSKKSFSALEQSAKSSFSSLYNGCSNSMKKLKNSVIADWNSIRNTLSKGITGKVTVTRATVYQTSTQALTQAMNERMAGLSRNSVDFYGARYKPAQVVSTTGGVSTASSRTNDRMYEEMKTQNKLLTKMLDVLMSERTTVVENTINLDGRAVAKGTAKYINEEINTSKTRSARLAGSFSF